MSQQNVTVKICKYQRNFTGLIMSTILLSIKPEYVRKILEGSKKYEFRRSHHLAGMVTHEESKANICKRLKINSRNEFEMLQAIAQYEAIGDETDSGVHFI